MELLSKVLNRTRVYYLSTGFNPDYLGQWLIDNCGHHGHPESRKKNISLQSYLKEDAMMVKE